MKIRRPYIYALFWAAAVTATAMILVSLGYSFAKGFLIASLFLPGALAAEYLFRQVKWKADVQTIMNIIFIVCTLICFEFLLITFTHIITDQIIGEAYPLSVPQVVVNPFFEAVIILLFIAGNRFIGQKFKDDGEDGRLTFTSDRHKVILDRKEILYIESNDSEVYVCATEGRRFRNKTGISQWANLLGEGFIRVHRSYIVRRDAVVVVSKEALTLSDGTSVPVSRKYRDTVELIAGQDGNSGSPVSPERQ